MARYKRCTSCNMILDTVVGTMVIEGVTKHNRTASHYAEARAVAESFVCEACTFIAARTPVSTPPDPATYEKLGGRGE